MVQDGHVRHIRIISSDAGFCINKADTPCGSVLELLDEKMGEKIKSKLAGGEAKETTLLVKAHYPPMEDEGSDDDLDMGALLSGR